jgi:hypothetical protein
VGAVAWAIGLADGDDSVVVPVEGVTSSMDEGVSMVVVVGVEWEVVCVDVAGGDTGVGV